MLTTDEVYLAVGKANEARYEATNISRNVNSIPRESGARELLVTSLTDLFVELQGLMGVLHYAPMRVEQQGTFGKKI